MKKDSNTNGFLIGAGGGVVSGLMLSAVSGATAEERKGLAAEMVILGALAYGGIGAWIDSAIEGRELIYRRATDPTHPVVSLSPFADLSHGAKRVGIGGAITWR